MNVRDEAAWELHLFLRSLGISYAIIGGAAVQIWGEPRLTQDVDLTASIPLDEPAGSFIQQVFDRFPARLENALEFARQNRVILIRASNGCPVDISMGLPGRIRSWSERWKWNWSRARRSCSVQQRT
jgi:hypothetical protein